MSKINLQILVKVIVAIIKAVVEVLSDKSDIDVDDLNTLGNA